MEPIKFPQANRKLEKPDSMTDDECKGMWINTDGHDCVSCWKLSFKDRLTALLHGRIWLFVLSGQSQPPVALLCEKTVFHKKAHK